MVKELAGKIYGESEGFFSVVKHQVPIERKDCAILHLVKPKMMILFEPTYPLQIVFNQKTVEEYNKVFFLLLQVEVARSSLLSRL